MLLFNWRDKVRVEKTQQLDRSHKNLNDFVREQHIMMKSCLEERCVFIAKQFRANRTALNATERSASLTRALFRWRCNECHAECRAMAAECRAMADELNKSNQALATKSSQAENLEQELYLKQKEILVMKQAANGSEGDRGQLCGTARRGHPRVLPLHALAPLRPGRGDNQVAG